MNFSVKACLQFNDKLMMNLRCNTYTVYIKTSLGFPTQCA